MDKRTFLFVLSLSLTLFFVNYYFDQQSQGELEKWTHQQQAKKLLKEKELEAEIAEHTVDSKQLPIVELYSDEKLTQFLAAGIDIQGTVLTFNENIKFPEKVYCQKFGTTTDPEELSLFFDSKTLGEPVLYGKEDQKPLNVGYLPDFGKYDLQLITTRTDDSQHFAVLLGEFTDGHFEIPLEKLNALRRERVADTLGTNPSDAIALLKTSEGYLPVAIYQHDTKNLLLLEQIPALTSWLQKPETKQAVTASQKPEEKFYVLENDYQQLVFSNYGAALAEINLPFETKSDKDSVVKEIEFDRDMVENHPYNAIFPAHAYYTPGNTSEKDKYEFNQKGKLGGYYPLLRRDLIEKNGKAIRIHPRLYGLNLVSEYPEVAELVYNVTYFDKDTIIFEATQSHRRIKKTFSVKSELINAPYCIDLKIQIEGNSKGLWLTSGVPEVEWISGSPAPALKYRITRNQKVDVENLDLPTDTIAVNSIFPDWICNSNGFFGLILDPLSEIDSGYKIQYISGITAPSRLVEIEKENERFKAQNMPGYQFLLPLKTAGGTMNFRIFAGPFATDILKAVDTVYSDDSTGYNPDYIACQSFHGWFSFISEPFAKFLFVLMNFFHQITGSWAFSIILLTIALRLMLYPLNAWSTKSMLKMQEIAPEVAIIQEKNKKDPKKAQLEIMSLYREKGVNPISGCFPLLIQMPFLIGMFDLLKSTFELRGASFIPGWIDNLTSPDVLFTWSTPIYFIGNQFHLLPILLGAAMFFQQRFSSTMPTDPNLMTDQQRQQRVMGNIMSVVFTLMFYNFPSGLNIYWLSSLLLGMLQQWWTGVRMKKALKKPIIIDKPATVQKRSHKMKK